MTTPAGAARLAFQVPMGEQLQSIVEHIRANSQGLPLVDLARLNLRVGKPISRCAATLPDDPEIVAAAWKAARAILEEPESPSSRNPGSAPIRSARS